jgi:fucose permease
MIGSLALWLMYAWLLCAIVASYLSNRKGYGEKVGLASGLLLHVVGVIVWLVWPAKDGSKWKTLGVVGRRRAEDVAPHAAATAERGDAA